MISLLDLEQGIEVLAEQGGLGNDVAQLGEAALVFGAGNPEPEVAVGGVFLVHVLTEPLPVLFAVEFGIMGESELDGATEHHFGHDVAVGLGYDFSVERTGNVAGGGPVVFDGRQ